MAWKSKRRAWIARGFGLLAIMLFFAGLDQIHTKASWIKERREALAAGDAVRLSALAEESRRKGTVGCLCLAGSVLFYLARVVVGVRDMRSRNSGPSADAKCFRNVKLKRLLICCIGAIGWEAFLVLMFAGRSFAGDLSLVGWISYLNTPGYAIASVWGERPWGPMDLCEVRWILGAELLSVIALRALVAKDLKVNLLWNVVLVAIYLISSVFVACNMVRLIT